MALLRFVASVPAGATRRLARRGSVSTGARFERRPSVSAAIDARAIDDEPRADERGHPDAGVERVGRGILQRLAERRRRAASATAKAPARVSRARSASASGTPSGTTS